MAHCSPPAVNPPVVIDNGSYTIKAGYAGDDSPRVTIPTVIGRQGDGQVFVGEEAMNKPDLTLEYPIERGKIKNWDGMIEIWRHVLKALNADPANNPILLTEAACVDKADREKMTQIFFETFNAGSIYLVNQAILTLYSCGKLEGFVLSSGDGVTQFVPCQTGYMAAKGSANARTDIGGSDLTEQLSELLDKQGVQVSRDVARQIKESCCFVAQDNGATPADKTYKLPDGKEIVLNTARTQVTEFFLKPSLIRMICDVCAKCSQETGMALSTLYGNIVLSGGNTLFEGMAERIQKEIQALAGGVAVKVTSAPGVNSCFIGGATLTCLADMQPLWITKKDYQEGGPAIVHTKCV